MAWADLALAGVKSVGSFLVAGAEAKNRRRWQKYNNALISMQVGQQVSTLNTNQNIARERSAEEAFLIRRSEYITKASAEVAAAATGTTGRSVNMTLFDIGRNAAIADRDRVRDFELQVLGMEQQKAQAIMQGKLSLDVTDIPSPNPFSALLGFAGEAGESINDAFASARKTVDRYTGPKDPWVQNGVNYRL